MSGYVPPFQMTDEITNLVAEISELVGIVSVNERLTPDLRLRRENRILSIYSSLAIEQNTLSLSQVTAVIEGKRVLGPPKDIQEVKNAFEAYERLSTLNPESIDDLLLAHRLMTRDLIPDAGCFRGSNVGVFRNGQLGGLRHAGSGNFNSIAAVKINAAQIDTGIAYRQLLLVIIVVIASDFPVFYNNVTGRFPVNGDITVSV